MLCLLIPFSWPFRLDIAEDKFLHYFWECWNQLKVVFLNLSLLLFIWNFFIVFPKFDHWSFAFSFLQVSCPAYVWSVLYLPLGCPSWLVSFVRPHNGFIRQNKSNISWELRISDGFSSHFRLVCVLIF